VNYTNRRIRHGYGCRQKLKALHDANVCLGAVSGVDVCFLLFSFLTKHCMPAYKVKKLRARLVAA
jgi:hypothetical protein